MYGFLLSNSCSVMYGFLFVQVAERQGLYVAKYLNGTMSEPFSHKSLGMLTYLGGYEALSDLPDIKLKGKLSYLPWWLRGTFRFT